VLRLVWHFIHLLVRFWYLVANVIENCLISSGLHKRYKAIDAGKLQYLAIVQVCISSQITRGKGNPGFFPPSGRRTARLEKNSPFGTITKWIVDKLQIVLRGMLISFRLFYEEC
jgi:hypothetical protein